MLFAKIVGDQVVKWPLTLRQLQAELPNVSFPKALTDAALAPHGYVCVDFVRGPDALPGHRVRLGDLVKRGNRWERTYVQELIPEAG
jgi:hypothetical protein